MKRKKVTVDTNMATERNIHQLHFSQELYTFPYKIFKGGRRRVLKSNRWVDQ